MDGEAKGWDDPAPDPLADQATAAVVAEGQAMVAALGLVIPGLPLVPAMAYPYHGQGHEQEQTGQTETRACAKVRQGPGLVFRLYRS
jgi:hypothetical protein